MKALLTIAIVSGFAFAANAAGHTKAKAPTAATATTEAPDCTKLTDAKAKADCEAMSAEHGTAHAAPVAPAKKTK